MSRSSHTQCSPWEVRSDLRLSSELTLIFSSIAQGKNWPNFGNSWSNKEVIFQPQMMKEKLLSTLFVCEVREISSSNHLTHSFKQATSLLLKCCWLVKKWMWTRKIIMEKHRFIMLREKDSRISSNYWSLMVQIWTHRVNSAPSNRLQCSSPLIW